MAGYKSVSFDPSAMQVEINTASSKCIVNQSAASDAASAAAAATTKASQASVAVLAFNSAVSDATSAAAAATAAASDAVSKATIALSAASDATSAVAHTESQLNILASSVIRSIPGIGSYAVKEFVVTSASGIKVRYSSVARSA